MASMTFVQSAEVKVKYDGNYSNIEAFNRQFEARLMQRNPLAMAIIKDQIKVKTMHTPMVSVYTHAVAVLTQIILAITLILHPDPHSGLHDRIQQKRTNEREFRELYQMIQMHDGDIPL